MIRLEDFDYAKCLELCPLIDKKGNIHLHRRPLRDICYVWVLPAPTHHGLKQLIEIPEHVRGEYKEGVGILLAAGPGWWGPDVKRRDPFNPTRYKEQTKEELRYKFHPTSDQLKPGALVKFNKWVPWNDCVPDLKGNDCWVKMCTASDIEGIIE